MTTYRVGHMCADIRGMLRRSDAKLKGAFIRDDGTKMTGREVREALYDCLAKGWKVLPIGHCEGFDYQTGCPGHEQEEEAAHD